MIPALRAALVALQFVLALAATAVPPAQAEEAPPPWQATEDADHPLVGKIVRVSDGAHVTPDELAAALARARLVLLGETHDNPDHHRIQGWAVARLVAAGWRPGIAMEMITTDRQAVIEAHFEAHPRDVAGLGPALGWERTGWPDWSHYARAIAPAISAGAALTAANLPQATMRGLAAHGFAVLGPDRLRELALDRPLPEPVYAAIAEEMVASHCGQLAASRARPFAVMQIARDAALADGLLTAAQRAGGHAVLVAGNGHVRRDRGVPLHLGRRGQDQDVVVVAPIEVRAAAQSPDDYAGTYGTAVLPFDYVWFTPRARREDPCRGFNKNR